MTKPHQFGLIGLAVMGENLVLNLERNGFTMAVYNRTAEKTKAFLAGRASGRKISGAFTMQEFAAMLERPRKILVMVKAGKAVDDLLAQILPHVAPGDIIIDAGNSFYHDTERRASELQQRGIRYMGMGVSGGEEGALRGPSIMPGGPSDAYEIIAPAMTKIAARVNGDPCCSYIGPGGSGHYVKMVHNGIEYGIMQVICEVYDVMRRGAGLSAAEAGAVFSEWDAGDLNSFLIEITGKVLGKTDAETGQPLVDYILDTAEQKGTGKWTSQNALDLGVALPTINAAVEARIVSADKNLRVKASQILHGPAGTRSDRKETLRLLHDALLGSMIVSYAQGLALICAASKEYSYKLRPDEIAKIWRGGCIIRARLLEPMRIAYRSNPELANLMFDEFFSSALNGCADRWRKAVQLAAGLGIPTPAMSASLSYFDSYRMESLPTNLLQAMRDYFGAHTYRRIDRDGIFHTQWEG
jgi:6-phosphogluconate dehydrogenase